MTIGIRKVLQFSLVWIALLAAEVILIIHFALSGALFSAPHGLLSAAILLTAAVVAHLLIYRTRPQNVPVMMYHSVADSFPEYPDQQIVLSTALFEKQLAWLDRKGYQSLHLGQLQAGLQGDIELPRRAICLTFDDGMLDNWVNVFPLLRKYGMKATFFVATDFIEEGDEVRPTLEDVWQGRVAPEDLNWVGYVRWSEIMVMQESGLVDFQPHGCTHDWAFTSDEIIDFHHPGAPWFWLCWLDHPKRKSDWLANQDLLQPGLGRPVYRFDRSLVGPAWFEDPGLRSHCERLVSENGDQDFFKGDDWRKRLHQAARDYRERHAGMGHMETGEAYRTRVLDELQRSRRLLQARTGSSADYFCWPGEQYSEESLRLALDTVGFQAVTCDHGENIVGRWTGLIGRKIAQEIFCQAGRPWLDSLLFRVNVKALEGNGYAYLLEFPLNRYKDLIVRRLGWVDQKC